MKKIFALVLVATILGGILAGCKSGDDANAGSTTTGTTAGGTATGGAATGGTTP